MTLLLCALSGFLLAQLAKMGLAPIKVKPLLKIVLAAAGSFGAAWLVLGASDWRQLVVYGFAGASLAVVVHKFTRLLSVLADLHIFTLLRNRQR
jgi:hypothetical protein